VDLKGRQHKGTDNGDAGDSTAPQIRDARRLPTYLKLSIVIVGLALASGASRSCGHNPPAIKFKVITVDQGKTNLMDTSLKPSNWIPDKIYVGVGDRHELYVNNKSIISYSYARKKGIRNNTHGIWITKTFKKHWINKRQLAEMGQNGITPLLIFYYFGDHISVENITANWEKYRRFLVKTSSYLATKQKLFIVFEPEFNLEARNNKTSVYTWRGFNEFIIATVKIFRHYFPQAKIGICPGDFRSHNFKKSIERGVKYVDFIAFQELWAATRKSNLSERFEDVTDYALSFTNYLHRTFKKPILLSYIGISSYRPPGSAQDWRIIQSDIIRNMSNILPVFIEKGLFGILYFELFDDPKHVGYFGVAERDFGLIDIKEKP